MVMAQVRTLDWLTFSVSTAQRNGPSTSCQLRMCLGMTSSYASTRLGIISNEAFVWLLSMRSDRWTPTRLAAVAGPGQPPETGLALIA